MWPRCNFFKWDRLHCSKSWVEGRIRKHFFTSPSTSLLITVVIKTLYQSGSLNAGYSFLCGSQHCFSIYQQVCQKFELGMSSVVQHFFPSAMLTIGTVKWSCTLRLSNISFSTFIPSACNFATVHSIQKIFFKSRTFPTLTIWIRHGPWWLLLA